MSAGIKNGKQPTFNIRVSKLIFLLIILMIISLPVSALKNEKGWVIVLDPGHGGKDPGASGSFSKEKDITLAIALKTGEYIEQNIRNVKVVYTRKNDSFIDIRERANIANKNKADLFISIHVNWGESKKIQGTETFIMGVAKNQQNLEVAMKENEVILLENDYTTKYEEFDPKSPESYIMFTLTQNIFQEQSTVLASKIQAQFKERINRTDRGVKQAGFWVLYNSTMPSVLTETGFITNPTEEKFLNSKQGQDYIASGIFRACRDYLNDIDSRSGISTDNTQEQIQKTGNVTQKIVSDGGLVYMVQISTSSVKNDINPENFKGIPDVIEINANDRFKYATGSFSDYSEAVKYRKKIESLFPDAFVIAVKDNKILPLQDALEQK